MDKASKAKLEAQRYSKMSDIERCAYMGELVWRKRYAYVTMPHRYEELVKQNKCLRADQIPEWIKGNDKVTVQFWVGGRGSGKSYGQNSYWLVQLLKYPGYRLGWLGPDYKISVNVGMTGVSGLITMIEALDPSLIQHWNKVDKVLTLVNGSQVFCFTSENPGSLEGPEFNGYAIDEVADLYNAVGEECVFRKSVEPGVRLGRIPNGTKVTDRIIVSGTFKATELVKHLADSAEEDPDEYNVSSLRTIDNLANISDKMRRDYERLKKKNPYAAKMRYEGELIFESPNALLTQQDITTKTGKDSRDPSTADKVTLTVDSNHSDDKKSDECGLIIHGLYKNNTADGEDELRVHADATTAGGPREWPDQIVRVLKEYPEIREVLVEDDKSMVIDFMRKVLKERMLEIGRPIRIRPVKHRNRSKKVRADPIAALYMVDRIVHDPCDRVPEWSDLSKLVWQWISWDPTKTGAKFKSPDRLDTDVYGGEYHLIRGRKQDTYFTPADIASMR